MPRPTRFFAPAVAPAYQPVTISGLSPRQRRIGTGARTRLRMALERDPDDLPGRHDGGAAPEVGLAGCGYKCHR
ncbi:hypothetical protein Asp14428_41680 [Actinoplanes sp. NBRC 14428]|nr:hypothetical protein Asp14428_41680 [Actinoplanes sp. NBRC 14428]